MSGGGEDRSAPLRRRLSFHVFFTLHLVFDVVAELLLRIRDRGLLRIMKNMEMSEPATPSRSTNFCNDTKVH